MQRSQGWLEYLRTLASPRLDTAVYALQWAHDTHCLEHGAKHRRVGRAVCATHEWLSAGYPSRVSALRGAPGISAASTD